MNIFIPKTHIILMATFALLNTIVPITIAYLYKKRYDVKISTFFIGVFIYIAFGMLLVQIPNALLSGLIKPLGAFINQNLIAKSIYVALLIAVVEEFGRLFTFRFMMKNRMNKNEALMMGVGHGGIQAMFTGTSIMMSNAILAFAIDSLGAKEYIAKLGLKGDELTSMTKGMVEFGKITGMEHLFSGSSPLLLMAGQIALTLIVYVSITDQSKKYLFPVAMLMHFLLLLPVHLVSNNVINNVLIGEAIMLIFTACIVYFAFQLYHIIEKK